MSALMEAVGLRKSYPARGATGRGRNIAAVAGVDLSVDAGRVLGILGASGAGKSTLARLLTVLERPDAGAVRFAGEVVSAMTEAELRPLRRRFQPVFQDSLAALDPRVTLAASVREPLDALGIGGGPERRRRVDEVFELVGLPRALGGRLPSAVSGGERQRAAIARALAPEPELLILDEPVSSLDLPVALQILDLLVDLRQRLDLAAVFISHDVGVVRAVCDRVAVMQAGTIVEEGDAAQVLDDPAHPYTRELLDAVPILLSF